MSRQREHGVLKVLQNGQLAGFLEKESSGAISFWYADEWMARGNAFPVSLSLPLREDRYHGLPVTAVFDNLLPDNTAIRGRLGERVGVDGRDSFSLLAALGRDCIGALQFLTDDEGPVAEPGIVEGERLDDTEVADILKNLSSTPLGVTAGAEFRISVAGAQEKTALLRMKRKWYRPRASTATTHILKPQIGKLPNEIDLSQSVENEHFCMTLLGNLGLPVAHTEIVDFDGVRALSVERFDRVWTKDNKLLRRPQEDLCQALGISPARKYEADGGPGIAAVMDLLSGSDNADDDRKFFLSAQICFWLLGAIDGHGKNFSIHLAPGGRYTMTPLYDVMSGEPNYAARQIPKNQMKLAMCVGRNRRYRMDVIARHHFVESAEMSGISGAVVDEIIAELKDAGDDAIEKTLASLPDGCAPGIVEPVAETFLKRLKRLAGGG